jgi:tetratricopeptide (TPR) repeat protein
MIASVLLAACVVPYRLHLTGIVAYPQRAAAIAERLKHERFEAVAKSLPPDDPEVGFKDLGWGTPEQLEGGTNAGAATMRAGETIAVHDTIGDEFLHLEETRPAMPCDEAVARYPDDELALLTRAAWRSQSGDRRGAIDDYSAVIRLDPSSYDARLGRASAYYAEGRYDDARADASSLGTGPGGGADLKMLLGMIDEARGDDDLATADLADAIAQYHGYMRDETGARYALGLAYSNLGYFAAAAEEFDARLKLHPDDAAAYRSRGFARFAGGDAAGAKRDLLAAARLDATSATPYVGLAIVSYSAGRRERGARLRAASAGAAARRSVLRLVDADREPRAASRARGVGGARGGGLGAVAGARDPRLSRARAGRLAGVRDLVERDAERAHAVVRSAVLRRRVRRRRRPACSGAPGPRAGGARVPVPRVRARRGAAARPPVRRSRNISRAGAPLSR